MTNSLWYRSIVPLNCYKLKMKVKGHQFVSPFIEITNVAWKVCTSLLVSQPSVCISSVFCLFFNNWLERLIFKPHNMIIVRKETLVNAMRAGLSLRSRTNAFCRNHGPISGVSRHNSDARRANFTGEVVA